MAKRLDGPFIEFDPDSYDYYLVLKSMERLHIGGSDVFEQLKQAMHVDKATVWEFHGWKLQEEITPSINIVE